MTSQFFSIFNPPPSLNKILVAPLGQVQYFSMQAVMNKYVFSSKS